MRRAGEVDDIGDHLWQFDYWDKIVTSELKPIMVWRRTEVRATMMKAMGNI